MSVPRVGDEPKVLSKTVELERMRLFAGYPEPSSVHTNEAFAHARGLPTVIAQGLETYSYMCEFLVAYFGQAWFRGGTLATSFLNPVYVGDTLRVSGAVSKVVAEESGFIVTVAVTCENDHGVAVAVGTATAPMAG